MQKNSTNDLNLLTPDDIERFWAKVIAGDNCWEWTAFSTSDGYGQMNLRKGGRQVKFRAHRISYWLRYGAIPSGMVIDHECHNRACVNPDHLRAVTVKQNNENLLGAQSRNPSGVRGVTWDRNSQAWRARVVQNGKEFYLGLFDTVSAASQAAVKKRLELQTHNGLDRIPV